MNSINNLILVIVLDTKYNLLKTYFALEKLRYNSSTITGRSYNNDTGRTLKSTNAHIKYCLCKK